MRVLSSLVALSLATVTACSTPVSGPPKVEPADNKVRALADSYLATYFERYPEQATYYGVPNRHHDKLPDNSLKAQTVWEQREDSWQVDLAAIDPTTIETLQLRAAYAILREAVESSIGTRVCRNELWNVSQMTGWQVGFGYLVTIQPVGTADARREALERWGALPQYLETEIGNLREGMRLGYTAPKQNVEIVIGQLNSLLSGTPEDSPFTSPATRGKDEAFAAAFRALYSERLKPAIATYRDFLSNEYLAAARDAIAVTANPKGDACYAAAIRAFSTLPVEPKMVHEIGRREIQRLDGEMSGIGQSAFRVADVPELLERARTGKPYLFSTREQLIAYSQAALARAKTKVPEWFGLLPKADVTIEPYPRFRERNASNEYNPPAEDGSRPGLFYINAYQAQTKSRAPAESTAFHETIPGHHLQIAIALERGGIHPLGRYILNSGFTEGWALYSERLADEMGLYSGDLDRLGMLSSQAFRAARLVVDSGIHSMGWTRQQAIDYMLAHTAETAADIAAEVDRYIVYPGQATAYMLGMLEIWDARESAKRVMGARFDIKAFHDRVLEDGAVPVSFLSAKVRDWAAGTAMPR